MRVGIIVAMNKEFDLIAHCCQDKENVRHTIHEKYGCRYMMLRLSPKDDIVIMRCGIGKVNAAVGAMLLFNMNVDCIISSGVAGSLNEFLLPGNIVVGTEYRYHDVYCGCENELGQIQGEPAIFKADKELLGAAYSNSLQHVYYGLILTGDSFVDKKEVAENIHAHNRFAYAVDMESCSIAQVCHKINKPFLSYRMISDSILNPTAISYKKFWEEAPSRMAKYTLSYVNTIIEYTKRQK